MISGRTLEVIDEDLRVLVAIVGIAGVAKIDR